MIRKIVNEIVEQMLEEQIIDIQQKEDYVYTYILLGEKLLALGTIFVLSIILKRVIPTAFFLLFFLSLRERTGGFHADTFFKCYLGTVAIYLIHVFSSDIWIRYPYVLWIALLAASILIALIGTVNHPNMDMNIFEIEGNKKRARWLLILEWLAMIILKICKADETWIIYMAAGIILCALLLFIAVLINEMDCRRISRN